MSEVQVSESERGKQLESRIARLRWVWAINTRSINLMEREEGRAMEACHAYPRSLWRVRRGVGRLADPGQGNRRRRRAGARRRCFGLDGRGRTEAAAQRLCRCVSSW